jgi:hypothetical protein
MSNEALRAAAEYVRGNDVTFDVYRDGVKREVRPNDDFGTAAKLLAAAMLARLDGKEDFYDGGSP